MDDQKETQEQMKVDMLALKEQMASMMEAMLGMRQLMEKNVATTAAVSSTAEADPTLLATSHHPPPNAVGRERSTLGHTNNPHLGYNRVAYPYGLPPNYMPPVMNDDASHVSSPILEREPPRQPDEVHEDHREYAQGDVDYYPPDPRRGVGTQHIDSAQPHSTTNILVHRRTTPDGRRKKETRSPLGEIESY